MTGRPEKYVNEARLAELWARLREELSGSRASAADEEVEEMLDEVFGPGGGAGTEERPTASEAETEEMLDEIFGSRE